MRDVSRNVEAGHRSRAEIRYWQKTFMEILELLPAPYVGSRKARPRRRATWLELFFDLIFVAAVAQVGDPSTRLFLRSTVRYGFLFFLIWWAWLDTPSIPSFDRMT